MLYMGIGYRNLPMPKNQIKAAIAALTPDEKANLNAFFHHGARPNRDDAKAVAIAADIAKHFGILAAMQLMKEINDAKPKPQ